VQRRDRSCSYIAQEGCNKRPAHGDKRPLPPLGQNDACLQLKSQYVGKHLISHFLFSDGFFGVIAGLES
jgi:hypothetical protein